MALGSTQSLTEMSASKLSGSKGRAAHKADNLTAICEPIVYKCGSLDSSNPYGSQWPVCYRNSFTFLLFVVWDETESTRYSGY
jgi:hypothetical protein